MRIYKYSSDESVYLGKALEWDLETGLVREVQWSKPAFPGSTGAINWARDDEKIMGVAASSSETYAFESPIAVSPGGFSSFKVPNYAAARRAIVGPRKFALTHTDSAIGVSIYDFNVDPPQYHYSGFDGLPYLNGVGHTAVNYANGDLRILTIDPSTQMMYLSIALDFRCALEYSLPYELPPAISASEYLYLDQGVAWGAMQIKRLLALGPADVISFESWFMVLLDASGGNQLLLGRQSDYYTELTPTGSVTRGVLGAIYGTDTPMSTIVGDLAGNEVSRSSTPLPDQFAGYGPNYATFGAPDSTGDIPIPPDPVDPANFWTGFVRSFEVI